MQKKKKKKKKKKMDKTNTRISNDSESVSIFTEFAQ